MVFLWSFSFLTLSDFLSRFGRRFRRTFVLFEERGQTKTTGAGLMTAFWLRQQGENFNMRRGHRDQTTYAVAFFPVGKLTPLGLDQRRTWLVSAAASPPLGSLWIRRTGNGRRSWRFWNRPKRRSFLLQGSPFFAAPTTVNAGAKVSIKPAWLLLARKIPTVN